MRTLLALLIAVAACDLGPNAPGETLELPASPPPPVPVAPGTPVTQTWQFTNTCPAWLWAGVRHEDAWLGSVKVNPGETVYVVIRCNAGDDLGFVSAQPSTSATLETGGTTCGPGVLSARRLTVCQ